MNNKAILLIIAIVVVIAAYFLFQPISLEPSFEEGNSHLLQLWVNQGISVADGDLKSEKVSDLTSAQLSSLKNRISEYKSNLSPSLAEKSSLIICPSSEV